jgi:enoyl-CoA hydratase/carnithine racemase
MARMIAEPMPRFEGLRLQHDGAIARLTLDAPQRLNALSPASMQALIDACTWLAAQAELRVLVLDASGRAFCAGYDLTAMRESHGGSTREATDLGRRLLDALSAVPAVTLAAVRGHCVGGGLLLAAACDLRLAADDARFSVPEMNLGIPLGWGGVPRLLRLLPAGEAMQLVLDGEPFDAAQALAWGFVNRIVPGDQPDAAAQGWAQRLADTPLGALRTTKRRFNQALQLLCALDGSEADADDLAAAYRDEQTLATMRRYMATKARSPE